jgi:hypothetical protein
LTDGTTAHEVEAAGSASGTFTVEGPVLAEILVIRLGAGIDLTGPCGPEPWLVEVGDADPTSVVARLVRANLGEPLVVHSTSWRRDRAAVVLTFVAVLPSDAVRELAAVAVRRAELARGEATAATQVISWEQVVEHALRHLAWLVRDDSVVAASLGDGWRQALEDYVPEPFRALG